MKIIIFLYFFIKKLKIPENPVFGYSYRTWHKNRVFRFGSCHQAFKGVKFHRILRNCFGKDTNIEIIVVNCLNTDN